MFIVRGKPDAGISAAIKYRLIVMRMAQALAKKDGASFEIGRAEYDVAEERWAIPMDVLNKYNMVWRRSLNAYIPRLMNESLDEDK